MMGTTASTTGIISKAILIVIVATVVPISFGFSVAPSLTRIKDTKVAVDGTATAVIPPLVHYHELLSQNTTLTNYMQLPVEQYVLIPMPLESSLTRIDINDSNFPSKSDDTKFELVVPTIHFFKLSLTPVVYASVQPHENRVVISSTKCLLRGSPFIERVQLNDRFDFTVTTTLTWDDASSQLNLANGSEDAFQSIPTGDGNQNGSTDEEKEGPPMEYSISAETIIKIDVDVPRPFSALPKMALEKTANAAVGITPKYIQSNFVENLATDYKKWASDVEYRNHRASLSKMEVEDENQLLVALEARTTANGTR